MKKKRKVYEVPELMVYPIKIRPIMQTGSPGQGSGTQPGPDDPWPDDDE